MPEGRGGYARSDNDGACSSAPSISDENMSEKNENQIFFAKRKPEPQIPAVPALFIKNSKLIFVFAARRLQRPRHQTNGSSSSSPGISLATGS